MQNKRDAVRDGFTRKRGMESRAVASSVRTASGESRMFLERLSNTVACLSFCARSAILRISSLESCVESLGHSGALRRAYSVHKVGEWPVSSFFFASCWLDVVWYCSFAPWESHPEGRSPGVGELFVGDRSRSNTSVGEEEGG